MERLIVLPTLIFICGVVVFLAMGAFGAITDRKKVYYIGSIGTCISMILLLVAMVMYMFFICFLDPRIGHKEACESVDGAVYSGKADQCYKDGEELKLW